MYRRAVERVLRSAFEGLNRGEVETVTGKFAVDAEHYFIGEHALSGTRRTPRSIRRWYERLLRLFPDIAFEARRVHVEGPPWRTLAVVEWSETNTGTDAVHAENEGTNVFEIRWGKVRRVRIYTDTARLGRTLDRLAASGNAEAREGPIEGGT